MHELSITDAILETVLAHARRERATRVHRVLLLVSELSDLKPIWLERCFAELAAGTVAAEARLEIESVAPSFRCRTCGAGFSVSLRTVERVRCACGSSDCSLEDGADYIVEEIEVS